jgi:hypothetical protein
VFSVLIKFLSAPYWETDINTPMWDSIAERCLVSRQGRALDIAIEDQIPNTRSMSK